MDNRQRKAGDMSSQLRGENGNKNIGRETGSRSPRGLVQLNHEHCLIFVLRYKLSGITDNIIKLRSLCICSCRLYPVDHASQGHRLGDSIY